MHIYWRLFWRTCLHGVIATTVAIALLLSVVRYYTPVIAEYRESLIKWLTLQTGKPVHINAISASWRGLGPYIDLQGLIIGQQKISQITLGFHLKEFWGYWRTKMLVPRTIRIDGMELTLPLQEAKAGTVTSSVFVKWLAVLSPIRVVTIDNLIIHTPKSHIDHLHLDYEQGEGDRHLILYRKDMESSDMNLLVKAEDKGFSSTQNTERGSMYIKLNNFDISRFGEIKEFLQGVHEGSLSTESWIEFKGYQPISAIGTVRLLDTEITNQTSAKDSTHIELATHYAWSVTENGWLMTGDKLQLTVGDVVTPNSQFRLNYSFIDNYPQYEFRSSFLVLDGLGELLSTVAVLPDPVQSALQEAHLRGHLSDASLHLGYDGTRWKYNFNGHFYELAIAPSNNRPGLIGLEAIVQADDSKGKLSILSRDFSLLGNQWFLHPLHFEQAVSTINWEYDNQLWKINIPELKLVNQDLDLDARAEVELANNLAPSIQFKLTSHQPINLAIVKEYLPDKLLSSSLDSWLHHSLQKGQVNDAEVVWQAHPGTDDGFFAKFNLADAIIQYNQKWPSLLHTNGHVVFANKRLDIQVDSAESEGLVVNAAHVAIPDIFAKSQTLLTVEGKLSSALQDVTPYLQHTPLWPTLNRQLSVISVKGSQETQLAFQIDLQGNQNATQVDGVLRTDNAHLDLPRWHIKVENLKGALHFTESAIDSKTLSGKLLGHPIHIMIGSKKDETNKLYTSIHGQVDLRVNDINHLFPNNWFSFFHGHSNWDIEWRDYVNHTDNTGKLIIESALKGISSELPYPLNKEATSAWPFRFEWDGEHYNSNIKHLLNTSFEFSKPASAGPIINGFVRFGKNAEFSAKTPAILSSGLLIDADLPKLDIDEWQKLFNQHDKENFIVPNRDISRVALSLAEMNFHGKHYHDVELSAMPSEQNQWDIKAQSKEIEGKITIPYDSSHPVVGEFSRCHLAKEDIEDPQDYKPSDMISLKLHCGETWYQKNLIGDLSLNNVIDEHHVLHMNQLVLKAPGYQIDAVGNWAFENNQHHSTLNGSVTLTDLAKLLKAFAINTEIEDSAGAVTFDFSAEKPLFNMGLSDLAGHFNLDLKKGRIVALQSNVGHVISLFSFQDIERRLRLDFSDVFKEGFSFDSFKGNFILANGLAETKDTEINGSSAYMKLIGKTNIANESFDLMVDVMPHVTGTLPIAAAVATGNPAIGAVFWVADKVISPSFRQLAKYQYHVTGPWKKPKVEAISSSTQSSS